MNAVLQCLFHLPLTFNLPFMTKAYEKDLNVEKSSIAKQYSRLLRHVVQNDERAFKLNMQGSTEFDSRFSEAVGTMQTNKKNNFVSTSEFRRILTKHVS